MSNANPYRFSDKRKDVALNYVRRQKIKDPLRHSIRARLIQLKATAKRNGHCPCSATVDDVISRWTTVCECCGKDAGFAIQLDHCHKTGKLRGFLCYKCNSLIGLAEDNAAVLVSAANYLN